MHREKQGGLDIPSCKERKRELGGVKVLNMMVDGE